MASLPDGLVFGVLPVQSAGTQKILVIRNHGFAALNVRDAVIAGDHADDFKLIINTCSAGPTLPNRACPITLQFRPLAGGERRATLIMADDASDSPQSVPLTGTGTERDDLLIDPAALNFADQATEAVSDWQAITLTNKGDGPVVWNAGRSVPRRPSFPRSREGDFALSENGSDNAWGEAAAISDSARDVRILGSDSPVYQDCHVRDQATI